MESTYPTYAWKCSLTVRSLTGRENGEVGPSGVRDDNPDELGHCYELDVLCKKRRNCYD